MGQSLSVDFRASITRMHVRPVTADDHDTWKAIFLTTMSSDDIAAFVSPRDVRMMRRCQPQNLALLLYKCLEQIAVFLRDAEQAAASGGSSRRHVVDECAVLNAVRIIAAVMPCAIEADVCEPFGEARNQAFPQTPRPESPHAANFHEAFFWRNDACSGSAAAGATVLPPLLSARADATNADDVVPFGEELVVALTRLMFVPGWTIDKAVQMLPYPIDMDDPSRREHGVVTEYLLCPGLLANAVPDGALLFAQDVKRRRYEVLRALVACFASPVARGDSLAPNPFLDRFVDRARNPLAATLCCSLVNYVSQYMARGVLPFTSHVWAELPEAFLAESLMVLALAVPVSGGFEDFGQAPTADVVAALPNAFVRFYSMLAFDDKLVNYVCAGLFRVIENPLFAATTTLKNSQRRVKCASEALNLALRLAMLPSASGFRKGFVGMADALAFPLLHFVMEAKNGREFFADAQIALYLLLILSADEEACKRFGQKFEGVMPFSELPPVDKQATYADVVLLALCDVMSPGTPRWLQPLINTAVVIMNNLAPRVALQEKQQFEVFHVVDYLTSSAFHEAAPKVVDRPNAIAHAMNALVSFATVDPAANLSLVAALATINLPRRLKAMLDPTVNLPPDASMSMSLMAKGKHADGRAKRDAADGADEEVGRRGAADDGDEDGEELSVVPHDATIAVGDKPRKPRLVLPPLFEARIELGRIEALSKLSHAVIEGLPADGEDPAEALREHLAEWPSPPEYVPIQELEPSEALVRYIGSTLWTAISNHHVRPPLLDTEGSRFFRTPPKLSDEVLAALAKEDADRVAAAEQAARRALTDEN